GVGNRIQDNFIGTDILGTNALSNSVYGILVNFNAGGSPRGDTLIGGSVPGAGNVIAFHALEGGDIENSTKNNKTDGMIEGNTIHSNVLNGIRIATLNAANPHYRITRNSIYANGRLGIDLKGPGDPPSGVTANDTNDVDTGPNNLQNSPLLMSVTV